MYICICKAVTDGQIREAINQGACTRKQLIECLRVGRDCGKCNADVRELLNSHAPGIQNTLNTLKNPGRTGKCTLSMDSAA